MPCFVKRKKKLLFYSSTSKMNSSILDAIIQILARAASRGRFPCHFAPPEQHVLLHVSVDEWNVCQLTTSIISWMDVMWMLPFSACVGGGCLEFALHFLA